MSSRQALMDWLVEYRRKQQTLSWLGAAGCLLAAFVVLPVTWWVIWLVLLVGFDALLGTGLGLILGTWFVFSLLFVAYLFADYQRLEKIHVEAAGRQWGVRALARSMNMPFLPLLAGPQAMGSFVKPLSVSLLSGPALLALALSLVQRAQQMAQLDEELLARLLLMLHKAAKRVLLDDIYHKLKQYQPEVIVTQARLIDGVVVREEENPGMYLTDSFMQELAAIGTA